MSMSTHVVGFITEENETYKKHLAVLKACHYANVSLPKETAEYFGDDSPELYLAEEKLEVEIPVSKWEDPSSSGFELNVSDIPEGVVKIRFYNSW